MADNFVPAFAPTTPVTVPAGSQIAVFSQSGFQVSRATVTPNFPPANVLIRDQAPGQDQWVSGVLDPANAVTVTIDATGGQPVWYSVGTSPIVRSGGRLESGGLGYPSAAQAINTSATATVAQFLSGYISSTTAAAVNVTMPTAAQLEAATTFAVGDSFECVFFNSGGTNALAIVGNTGVTLVGTASITSGTMRVRIVKTAASTFVVYRS